MLKILERLQRQRDEKVIEDRTAKQRKDHNAGVRWLSRCDLEKHTEQGRSRDGQQHEIRSEQLVPE